MVTARELDLMYIDNPYNRFELVDDGKINKEQSETRIRLSSWRGNLLSYLYIAKDVLAEDFEGDVLKPVWKSGDMLDELVAKYDASLSEERITFVKNPRELLIENTSIIPYHLIKSEEYYSPMLLMAAARRVNDRIV